MHVSAGTDDGGLGVGQPQGQHPSDSGAIKLNYSVHATPVPSRAVRCCADGSAPSSVRSGSFCLACHSAIASHAYLRKNPWPHCNQRRSESKLEPNQVEHACICAVRGKVSMHRRATHLNAVRARQQTCRGREQQRCGCLPTNKANASGQAHMAVCGRTSDPLGALTSCVMAMTISVFF